MKAIVHDRYGPPDVLRLAEVAKPTVGDTSVLIRVHAASVNHGDWVLTTGTPYVLRAVFGLRRPKQPIRGRDVAGTVESIGSKVTLFRPGDAVYAEVDTGSFAEYVSVSQDRLGVKPANLTFEQAATVPLAGSTALQGLRDRGRVQPGQQVLINGASGGVGTFAVQIAKALGAEVTGVCSTRNAELVRSLGADHVVDYTQEDFTRSGRRYDLIFDVVGSHSLSDYRRALTPTGTLIMSSGTGSRWFGPIGRLIRSMLVSPFIRHKVLPLAATNSHRNLADLTDLIESGKLTPAIDRTYPLSQTAEAMRYFEQEHARAKIAITV